MAAESPQVSAKEIDAQPDATTRDIEGLEAKTEKATCKPEPDNQSNQNSSGKTDSDGSTDNYLQGWRLWCLTAGLWISLFLSTLETSIVSTSLLSITNALSGFLLRDWIVTAYLLTYTGFLTIFAKLSDLFGQKTMLILALGIFTLFSGLCGASTHVVELIIFRAFQGIGASGIYSLVLVIAPGLVPASKYGKYMAIVSTVYVLASVLGPILGGVIAARTTWRWVFLLNLPGGALAILLVAIFLPPSEESSQLPFLKMIKTKIQPAVWARLDVLGTFFLLAFSVLLVFALEEGGTRFPWKSAAIIASLTVAILLWISFVIWEIYLEKSTHRQEPIFPPSICKERLPAAMLLSAFFVGFPFVSIVVNTPQRAQAVYGKSPLDAGISLLPFLLASPLATALSGYLSGQAKVPLFYILISASVIQLIGISLTCSLPTDTTTLPKQLYAYEAIMGFGFGLGLATLLVLARVVVSQKNLAVIMGATTQIRVLGGTISLAICATILNNSLTPKLSQIVTSEQSAAILESLSAIKDLTEEQQVQVKYAFAQGYNKQNIFMAVLTGLGFIATCFLWERNPRRAV